MDREEIEGSAFEIRSDISLLKMIFKKNDYVGKQLLEKIKDKINKNNIRYFYSQEYVISLFDVLQKNGLESFYKSDLLDIAKKLIKKDENNKPVEYDPEDWAYQNYYNNIFVCDAATKLFIYSINRYNQEEYAAEILLDFINVHNQEGTAEIEDLEQNPSERISQYRTMLFSEKLSIDEMSYKKILRDFFFMFNDKDTDEDVKELWDLLLEVTIGPGRNVAEDVLRKLIEKTNDDIAIIRYTSLLEELERQEFLKMKAAEMDID